MEHFILKYTWFILYYIFGFCGIFPCQRTEEGSRLKLTSTSRFWWKFFSTYFVIKLSFVLENLYVFWFEKSFEDINNLLMNEIAPKKTDKFAMTITFFTEIIIQIVGITNIRGFAKKLVQVQNHVNDHAKLNIGKIRQNVWKSYLQITITLSLFITAMCVTFVGITYQLKLSQMGTILHIVFTLIPILSMYLPMFYMYITYLEVTLVFENWCLTLSKIDTLIIEDVKHFLDGLRKVSKMYSPMLFWLISLLFFDLVVISYACYAYCSDIYYKSPLDWLKICLALGEILIVVYLVCMLYILCHKSEKMVQGVQILKLAIEDMYFSKNADCRYICSRLDTFHGFKANGYFIVNHSLLTGMAASFATFLVILIQFSQSELNTVTKI